MADFNKALLVRSILLPLDFVVVVKVSNLTALKLELEIFMVNTC